MLNSSIIKKKSKISGYGLYAAAFIPKGSVIWCIDIDAPLYSYEDLVKMEIDIDFSAYRYKDNYIIATGDDHYMNHSCEPNTWHEGDNQLVAMRNIYPGEEITYDYASSEIGCSEGEWKCNCVSKKCRGFISDRDCLDKKFQKKFKGHLPTWVLAYIEKEESKKFFKRLWKPKFIHAITTLSHNA